MVVTPKKKEEKENHQQNKDPNTPTEAPIETFETLRRPIPFQHHISTDAMSQPDKAAQRHKSPSIPVSVIAPSRKKQSKASKE